MQKIQGDNHSMLIRGGRVIDPANKINDVADV